MPIKVGKSGPREGTRVVFLPSSVSMALYNPDFVPSPGSHGSVTKVSVGTRKVTFILGPGGGLVYVKWDDGKTFGVSPRDLYLEKEWKEQGLSGLAEFPSGIDAGAVADAALSEAARTGVRIDDADYADLQRQLVDLAHRTDATDAEVFRSRLRGPRGREFLQGMMLHWLTSMTRTMRKSMRGFSGFASLAERHTRSAQAAAEAALARVDKIRSATKKGDCGSAFFNVQVAEEYLGEARGHAESTDLKAQAPLELIRRAASEVRSASATFAKSCLRKK